MMADPFFKLLGAIFKLLWMIIAGMFLICKGLFIRAQADAAMERSHEIAAESRKSRIEFKRQERKNNTLYRP